MPLTPEQRRRQEAAPLTRILWLGDSLDQHAITCFCARAGGEIVTDGVRHGTLACLGSGSFHLAQHFVYGVHPAGPYHMQEHGSAVERTAAAAQGFRCLRRMSVPRRAWWGGGGGVAPAPAQRNFRPTAPITSAQGCWARLRSWSACPPPQPPTRPPRLSPPPQEAL